MVTVKQRYAGSASERTKYSALTLQLKCIFKIIREFPLFVTRDTPFTIWFHAFIPPFFRPLLFSVIIPNSRTHSFPFIYCFCCHLDYLSLFFPCLFFFLASFHPPLPTFFLFSPFPSLLSYLCLIFLLCFPIRSFNIHLYVFLVSVSPFLFFPFIFYTQQLS